MYFKQIVREDLGCAAYVVGSTDAGAAAVVDPRIDMVDEILSLVAGRGMRLTHIIETHNHADHVSGHGRLAEQTGAKIYIHPEANAEYPHEDLPDGAEIDLGEVRLTAVHTPGHRPEHLAVAVADLSRSDEPWVVLTGDSLFIGDVARPDLAVPGEQGAEALYGSLFEKLLKLPDGVEVYPAHVAGSLCGRVSNLKTSTTIGYERRHNPALAPKPVEEFVRYMNESLPQRPPNMTAIVEANRTQMRHEPTTPPALPAAEFRYMADEGYAVLDTRSPASFGAGHVPGAINVYIDGGQFGTRVGFVIPSDARLLLVLEDDSELDRVLSALSVVGYDGVDGYLEGGMDGWRSAGLDTVTLPQVSVQDLAGQLKRGESVGVLDVREDSEWEADHIRGAVHIPFHRVQAEMERVPDGPVAVICGSGQRSSVAASVLQRAGREGISNVMGGMSAWKAAGLPVRR